MQTKRSFSVAIAGYGGNGVITSGQLLLKIAAKLGYYGLAQRAFGPQIRGGESLSTLRLASSPVNNQDDDLDVLVLLDTEHVERFAQEVSIGESTCVVIPSGADIPNFVSKAGVSVRTIPLQEKTNDVAEGGENIVVVAYVAALLGWPEDLVVELVAQHFVRKPELQAHVAGWLAAGASLVEQVEYGLSTSDSSPQWLADGSAMLGLGVLEGGARYVAAYPITPATGVLEWLAPRLEQCGGSLTQAEDELASINMIIGASFGGVPSMTATSGPGLSLMVESLGLAVASETPLLVVDVMRGGPSTGIPTKSEQSDLNIALHGLHGDAPHVVSAALSIADGRFTAAWSMWLAESLQVPVICLSDQAMAQSDASFPEPPCWPYPGERLHAADSDEPYHRYMLTDTGISPMAIPGEPNNMYTADGLEHNPHGTPSASAVDHQLQLEKRANKLLGFDYGEHWGQTTGNGDILLICWGSMSGVCEEAAQRLRERGHKVQTLALRLLAPLQVEAIVDLLTGKQRVLVVEQSHGAQFYAWLRSHIEFTIPHHSLALPGPLPIRPGQIVAAVEQWDAVLEEVPHASNC